MGWYVPNSRSVDLAAKETTLETVKKNANAALLQHQFSHVQLGDPRDGGPPGSLSLGFSRQEHRRGLPFPSPVHESLLSYEKNAVVPFAANMNQPRDYHTK